MKTTAKASKRKYPKFVVLDRNNKWRVRVPFPTTLRDKAGRIIYEQVSRECFPETEERAAEVVRYIQAEHKRDAAEISEAKKTLSGFMDHFLEIKKKNIDPRTDKFYRFLYRGHIENSPFGKMEMVDIKPQAVELFYSDGSMSADRVKKLHSLLMMTFEKAVKWGLIASNPAQDAILPKHRPKETVPMSVPDLKKFLKVCREDDRFIIFEVAFEAALRPQEVAALRWADIDLTKRRLKVTQAVGMIEIKDPKTPTSRRVIGFSEDIKARLQAQRLNVAALKSEFTKILDEPLELRPGGRGVNYRKRLIRLDETKKILAEFENGDLVFPSATGVPFTINNLNRRDFKNALRRAGIDEGKYAFKTLRHTALTILADKLHPKKLQKFAGHAQLSTTLKFYVHVDDDSVFDASEAMGDLLKDHAPR